MISASDRVVDLGKRWCDPIVDFLELRKYG